MGSGRLKLYIIDEAINIMLHLLERIRNLTMCKPKNIIFIVYIYIFGGLAQDIFSCIYGTVLMCVPLKMEMQKKRTRPLNIL